MNRVPNFNVNGKFTFTVNTHNCKFNVNSEVQLTNGRCFLGLKTSWPTPML